MKTKKSSPTSADAGKVKQLKSVLQRLLRESQAVAVIHQYIVPKLTEKTSIDRSAL
jgi:hypothetical protein